MRSVSSAFPFPVVVRLTIYIRVPGKRIILTRKNILKRDSHTCQYCGKINVPLTVDHVLPKTFGGNDEWENLVCACVECNNVKGNRTPEQAKMKLLKTPRRPNHLIFIQHYVGVKNKKWKPYLFLS